MPYVSQVKGSDNVIYDIRAKELVPSVVTEGNQIPYNYRATNGGYVSDIGNREIDTLVGGTVAWNQWVQNGNFATSSGWSSGSATLSIASNTATVTLTGSAWNNDLRCTPANKFVANHIYAMSCKSKMSSGLSSAGLFFGVGAYNNSDRIEYTSDFAYSMKIIKLPSDQPTNGLRIALSSDGSSLSGQSFSIQNFNCIDLTQMFGSTVADYVYGLEQATAGAGVSWFRNLFPNTYYAYNAGELMSVKALSHKTVGKNLVSPVLSPDGTPRVNGVSIVKDNDKLTMTTTATDNYMCYGVFYYLRKGTYEFIYQSTCSDSFTPIVTIYTNTTTIITGSIPPNTYRPFTLSEDTLVEFRMFASTSGNGVLGRVVSIYGFQTEIGTSHTSYEPYQSHTYPLDTTLELRGIPKLDSNNKLYYDGDTYSSDGSVVRKYGIVDLGSLSWVRNAQGSIYIFLATVTGMQNTYSYASPDPQFIGMPYTYKGANTGWASMVEDSFGLNNNELRVRDDSYTTGTALQTALSGKYIIYPLATSTTESATPYTNPQVCDPYGTEEYTDTRDVKIPVGHTTTYYHYNERSKLDSLPSSADTGDGVYVIKQESGNQALIPASATNITYDNTSSGLTATDAQSAIDEISGSIIDDYNDLQNKPQINSIELSGNKSLDDLGIQPSEISKTASGSIATFSDGGDDIPVSEYECEIVAQQASGTPTSVSPLPITGFSQADIVVCGKNLFNKATIVNNKVWTGGGEQSASGFFHSDFIKVKPNTTYYSNSNGSGFYYTIYFFDSSKTLLGRADVGAPSAFTTTADTVWVIMNNNPNNTPLDELQLTEGNTAQAYSAYNGNTYLVEFGQTIYGGRLIYKNGEWSIEATHEIVDLGSLSWVGLSRDRWNTTELIGSIKTPSANSQVANIICSALASESADNVYLQNEGISVQTTGDTTIYSTALVGKTSAEVQTALTGVQFVYELATPVIIPITSSTRVKTISGVNNIYSNTGNCELTYFTENADEIAELVKAEIASTNADYHEYSTEEQIVGKWINGKTLYEKTVDHTFTSGAQAYTVFASGIEMAFAHTYMVEYSTNRWISMDVISKANVNNMVSLQVEKDANGALILNDIGSTARRWIAVIRYTKS